MARYIDLEDLERQIKENVPTDGNTPYEIDLLEWCKDECIRQGYAMPVADVVPKSEVEKLQAKIDEFKKDRYQILPDGRLELLPRTDVDKIKSELAREIFEEIESKMTLNKATHCGRKFYYTRLEDDIAELKKKYI